MSWSLSHHGLKTSNTHSNITDTIGLGTCGHERMTDSQLVSCAAGQGQLVSVRVSVSELCAMTSLLTRTAVY